MTKFFVIFYLLVLATFFFPNYIEWYHTDVSFVVTEKQYVKFDNEEKYILTHEEECRKLCEIFNTQKPSPFYCFLLVIWGVIFVFFCAAHGVFIV